MELYIKHLYPKVMYTWEDIENEAIKTKRIIVDEDESFWVLIGN